MVKKLIVLSSVSIVIFLFMTHVAFAQMNTTTPSIIQIKQSIMTIQELERQGILTHAEAERSETYYIVQASKAAGHTLTLNEILMTPDPSPQTLTPLQAFVGAIDFLNTIMVLGSIAVVGAVAYLFKYYVKKLLQILIHIPVVIYEIVFYAACLACGIWGWFLPEPIHNTLGFVACLLFVGALGFSTSYRRRLAHVFLFCSILFLVWAPAAILFRSSLIGFLAVGALLMALEYITVTTETLASIRSQHEGMLERVTLIAFIILALFIGLRLIGTLFPALSVFEAGALFLGSFAGYSGLLILANQGYTHHARKNYWGFQIVTIVAGIGALFFGSVFQINELQKIGGTFFVLYCIAKIGDIPTRSRPAFAMLIAIIGIITICFCLFALTHQALFRQWLFLPD